MEQTSITPKICIQRKADINYSSNNRGTFFQYLLEGLLFIFIIGLLTLSNFEGLSRLVVLYGLMFSFLYVICFLYLRLRIQLEVLLFFGWICCALIGSVNVNYFPPYYESLITVIQINVLLFVIAGIVAMRRNLAVVLAGIAFGGLIVGVSAFLTGEYQISVELGNARLAGITNNANSFAYHLMFVIIAMLFFLQRVRKLWFRIGCVAVITISILGIILSGSRKVFLAVLILLAMWYIYCFGKNIFRRPSVVFLLFALVGGIYFTTNYVLSNTFLGQRFEQRQFSRGYATRLQMYLEGFEMLKKHPALGVGLNNYRAYSTSGMYSHSDYIEVAANTGVIGFLLYYSIYLVLWRRISRLKNLVKNDPWQLYVLGFFKASIITILLLALGRPNITSKITWVFLAGAIGYLWSIERLLLCEKKGN